jgi:hypothetical protein
MEEVNGAASGTTLGVNGTDTGGVWLEFYAFLFRSAQMSGFGQSLADQCDGKSYTSHESTLKLLKYVNGL